MQGSSEKLKKIQIMKNNETESAINSARWQQLTWLKVSAFFFLQKNLVVNKHNNLGLVTPFSGW